MPRWGPDSEDRLHRAAMQLILERGYDGVTVAEIAEHAGLTKRSFFRHYADKREVVFAGSADFQRGVVDGVRSAPAGTGPVDAVVGALARGGAVLTGWGEPVRLRHRMVAASPELRERELIKLDALTTAITGALRDRGVEELTAELVARAGVAAFTTAFRLWAEDGDPRDLATILDGVVETLRGALGGRRP